MVSPMIGRTLGRYHVLEKIGQGGMGEVFRAHDTRLQRDVALKLLPAGPFENERTLERFRQEALALSKLNHPNIASVYDFDTDDDGSYMVMELIQGQTVSEKILHQPLSEEELLRLGRQAADGLAAAHASGVLHRDLKPSNLMVTPEGRLKILDFGLAKTLKAAGAENDAGDLTASQEIMGTLQYMAPEQLSERRLDERCDVHGLGCVLYQMATGRRPFPQQTAPQLIDAILNAQPTPPTELNPSVSDELELTILKALQKDPDRRHQSASELARALGAESAPGMDRPEDVPTRAMTSETIDTSTIRLSALAAFHSLKSLPRTRPRSFAVSLTVFVVALAAALWTVRSQPALSFSARDWVLVADFDNQTGEPVFDRSLSAAFTVGLEQSAYANVFSRARIDEALERMGMMDVDVVDETLGRELAVRENLRGLVSPSISKIGSQYSIAARLLDPVSGNTVRSYLEVADGQDEILEALDDIGAMIRRDLGESLASISMANRPLPQITTPSLEALQSYAEGEHQWASGEYEEALRLYQSAVEQDPDFAMAHAALGSAYYSYIYNNGAKGKEHFEKAIELSGRTTERERLGINVSFKMSLGYDLEARELYNIYLASYPDDLRMRYNYGNLLRRMEQTEDAVEQYLDVLRVDPTHSASHVNLATSYTSLGRHEDALASYAKAFDLRPELMMVGALNHEYGMVYVRKGDFAAAREVFDLAVSNADAKQRGLRSQAILDMYLGRYHSATTHLEEAILVNESKKVFLSAVRDLLYLSIARGGLGDRDGRLRRLDEAAGLAGDIEGPQVWLWTRIGAAYARADALEDAERMLDFASSQADMGSSSQSHDIHWLEGEIALARGSGGEAIDVLALAEKETTSPFTMEALARAHAAVGNRDESIQRYETLIEMRDRMIGWEPQQIWLEAHVELAGLYTELGNENEARKLTEVIVALWSDADEADLPLLRRIAQLDQRMAGATPSP